MSHTIIFHTTKMIPVNPPHPKPITTNKTLSSRIPILPPFSVTPYPPRLGKPLVVVVKASVSASSPAEALANGDLLDRCFRTMSAEDTASSSSPVMYAPPSMKKDYGAFGAVTLEKSKLDMTQKQTKSSPELATGGGGGDIGKRISHGGGDGGDDGGDDDSYFDDFDDGDDGEEGGLFRRRIIFQELFDRKFVDAVLNEWLKTVMDLPAGFRQAYELGLVSSAQMAKFLAINARPTTARSISRMLPQGLSRAFIGRMIADPAFLYKLLLEQAATIGCSLWWEVKNRKERIKQEWDLALLNVLTVTACNAIVVWSLAPCRSYGNTFQHDIQNTVQKLPNNIFERSYPLREFDLRKRIHSFIYKFIVLGTVGSTAGAVQASVSNLASSRKEGRLSVTIPSVSTYAVRYGAFLGLYANLWYQLLNGLDRAAVSCFDVIGVPLFFSTALRVLNVQLGETSRPALLGVDVDQLVQSDLLKAYNRPSESLNEPSSSSSKWFISKRAILSGLSLLGIKQEHSESTNEGEEPSPKARRKRIVRKKGARSRV